MKIDMFFGMGLFFIFVYFVIIFIKEDKANVEKETLDYNDMEELFFKKVTEGSISYKLLSIYAPLDLMMIKSLFMSESIPYYIEFEYLMSLRPFVHSKNYNDVKFYILEEDYNDAIVVINSYVKNKNSNEYRIKNVLRNIFEYLLMVWVVPSHRNYLGIDINYKNLLTKAKNNCEQ